MTAEAGLDKESTVVSEPRFAQEKRGFLFDSWGGGVRRVEIKKTRQTGM